MDLSAYYQLVIKALEASTLDAQKHAEKIKQEEIQRQEEAKLSSSDDKDHKCEKECKHKKLLAKFSPELLSKLMEYNLDPNGLSPRAAIKKLLTLGMPVEHVLLDLQESGKNITSVENLLAKHGLSSQLNNAIAIGLENRSMASAVAYAEGLIEKTQKTEGLSLNQVS